MREIKFRAYDTTGKKMYSNEDIGEYTLEQLHRLGVGDDYTKFMQYTGLKDKNGVEIYEGDILKHPKQACLQVRYGNNHFDYAGFTLINAQGMTNTLQNSNIYEVVGNIHQNPELLEGYNND